AAVTLFTLVDMEFILNRLMFILPALDINLHGERCLSHIGTEGGFELAVCASPDYIAKAGLPKTPEDLLQHQCLGFTNWRSQSGWRLMQKQLGSKTGPVPRFESNNAQALRTAAVKGIGINHDA
ncbi:MAG: LysR substrate-binding domain-containing protein, partial [Gammaproteobacteria bacterium]